MHIPLIYLALLSIAALTGCGSKIDTGRNDDPRQWSGRESPNDPGNEPNQGPGNENSTPGTAGPGSSNGSGNGPTQVSCFTATTKELPSSLQKICNEYIQPNPLLGKIHQYLCVEGRLIAAMNQPSCGWQGDPANMNQFIQVYEREPESSGKDYEDVHATMVHAPVSAAKFLEFVGLAFEDYNAFKARGFQWVSGTRENTNLNNGTFASGVLYRFRVEKPEFELGYSGRIQLFQIDDKTWLHVNYADHDFNRIKLFEQIAIYHDVGDGSSLIMKLEHKAVKSNGVYLRAWHGAVDMMKDFMMKCWTNAMKAK